MTPLIVRLHIKLKHPLTVTRRMRVIYNPLSKWDARRKIWFWWKRLRLFLLVLGCWYVHAHFTPSHTHSLINIKFHQSCSLFIWPIIRTPSIYRVGCAAQIRFLTSIYFKYNRTVHVKPGLCNSNKKKLTHEAGTKLATFTRLARNNKVLGWISLKSCIWLNLRPLRCLIWPWNLIKSASFWQHKIHIYFWVRLT